MNSREMREIMDTKKEDENKQKQKVKSVKLLEWVVRVVNSEVCHLQNGSQDVVRESSECKSRLQLTSSPTPEGATRVAPSCRRNSSTSRAARLKRSSPYLVGCRIAGVNRLLRKEEHHLYTTISLNNIATFHQTYTSPQRLCQRCNLNHRSNN